jgi:hypothetical protein
MPVKSLATYIWLPPGAPSAQITREFFHRVFEDYGWFQPVRYGRATMDQPLDPGRIDHDALVAYYERYKNITVAARTDRDFFLLYPTKPDSPPFVGSLSWETSVTGARKVGWRSAHVQQVAALMRLFGSPLALSAIDADFERKWERLVPNPDGFGSRLTFTVRDPSQGLAGVFWRNFYGPPFVRMFGGRLSDVPAAQKQELDGGIVLVQPYELPTQAMTPDGDAAEQQLCSQLGSACFYDQQRGLMPTHVPDLPRTREDSRPAPEG